MPIVVYLDTCNKIARTKKTPINFYLIIIWLESGRIRIICWEHKKEITMMMMYFFSSTLSYTTFHLVFI